MTFLWEDAQCQKSSGRGPLPRYLRMRKENQSVGPLQDIAQKQPTLLLLCLQFLRSVLFIESIFNKRKLNS